jgi:LmbE family N-acetylglucosaminyl deacetylase
MIQLDCRWLVACSRSDFGTKAWYPRNCAYARAEAVGEQSHGTTLKIAVVSPHFDDACFSLGASLLTWTRDRHAIDILDCFTVSNFVSGGTNCNPTEVSLQRRLEEASFVQHVGSNTRYADLGEVDAPLRLLCPVKDVFGHTAEDDPAELERLQSALRITISYDVLAIPLAAGRHIDHELAKEAAVGLVRDHIVAFYEDLPYSAKLSDHAIMVLAKTAGNQIKRSLVPLVVGSAVSWKEKSRLVQLYKSQVTAEIEAAIGRQYERYGGGERLWVEPGFIDIMCSSSHSTVS